jgi:adenine specific DNA methylase Mod
VNRLFYGDNLGVLREHIRDESVDLIYLDPPFNSQANYNVLHREPTGQQSKAQVEAFVDTWYWNNSAEQSFSTARNWLYRLLTPPRSKRRRPSHEGSKIGYSTRYSL